MRGPVTWTDPIGTLDRVLLQRAAPLTSTEQLGASDCEELADGWLVQPVNSATSAAYVVVGLVILVAMTHRRVDRARTFVYGACVAAIGVGSVVFHGPQPTGARAMHDLPILVTVWFVVMHDLRLIVPAFRRDLMWFAIGTGIASVVAFTATDVVAPLTGLAAATLTLLEVLIVRRGLRPLRGRRVGRAYGLVIVVAGLAAVSWVLGRTDSAVCDPDAVFQFHGLWHGISAIVFGLWWWLAFWIPSERSPVAPTHTQEADQASKHASGRE